MQLLKTNPTARLVLIYGSLSGLWIFLSDRLLAALFRATDVLTAVQTYKGWAFTAVSAALLYFLVDRELSARRKGQAALERYRMMADSMNTIIFFVEPDTGGIVEANAAAAAALGYSREELLTMTMPQLRVDGTRPPELDEITRAGGGRLEATLRRKNGEVFPTSATITVAHRGEERLNLIVLQDLTRARQLQSMQELLHHIDQRILQKESLEHILQYACEQVAGLFGYQVAWIGLKEAGGTVRCAAVAGAGSGRAEGIEVIWSPVPNGPTGRAIFTGQTQLSPLDPDPRGEGRPDLASLYGPWVCLAQPLTAKGQTVGVLSLYALDAAVFDAETRRLLRHFANQVALSVLAARDHEQITLQTAALETAANAVLIADKTGLVLWVNQAWYAMSGYTEAETIGQIRQPLAIAPAGQKPDEPWNQALLSGEVWTYAGEARRKDGSTFYLDQIITPVRNGEGAITHMIAIAQDVTERRQQEEHLRFLALHDPLTGLPNRRALQDGLEQLLLRSTRERPGAMILLDLDHFKVVNDTLGDTGGDELLIALTRLLQTSLRSGDLLTRFGGDQFAVLVNSITVEAARTRAESLRTAVSEFRFQRGELSLNVSASVGVAMIDGTLDASGVKALANAALVAAKEAGKNQVALYRSERDKPTDLVEENRLAAMIKEAVREDRLCLYFQPVVHLGTGAAHHYEALLRLRQADGTVLPPAAFLGAAERFRLMPVIDHWVLDSALSLLEKHPRLHLFVNLSGQSLSDETLLAYAETRLRLCSDKARRLAFEITETAAVRDMERVRLWMGQLKALGCRFALDDFGIGFSSFAYLRALPADYVKIDGSFIRNLDTDPTNRSLVEAMYTAAHTLGKVVVAEWVENEAIGQVLKEIGVEYGQGYCWGQPVPSLPGQL